MVRQQQLLVAVATATEVNMSAKAIEGGGVMATAAIYRLLHR
jgi:hypothetical protein